MNKKGRQISKKFIRNMLKHYAAEAGIDKPIYPHLIRKSAGTELAMVNPKLGQIQLGHKSIKTTLDHYTIPNDADKERINSILSLSVHAKLDSMLDRIEQYAIELDNMVESHLTYDLTPIYSMDVEVCHDDNRPKI